MLFYKMINKKTRTIMIGGFLKNVEFLAIKFWNNQLFSIVLVFRIPVPNTSSPRYAYEYIESMNKFAHRTWINNQKLPR